MFEDTVYAVAHDVIAVLKRYAEIDKAVSGPADLPMLSVLQSIREHIATLVHPGFIGATPPASLPRGHVPAGRPAAPEQGQGRQEP